MASKRRVGGLSHSARSENLREHFARCGTAESATDGREPVVDVATARGSGGGARSGGFGDPCRSPRW